MGARLERGSWRVQPIFDLLAKEGQLSTEDLLSTFNLGLGFVVVSPDDAPIADGQVVGRIEAGERGVTIR